jgi:hypothetical protein
LPVTNLAWSRTKLCWSTVRSPSLDQPATG